MCPLPGIPPRSELPKADQHQHLPPCRFAQQWGVSPTLQVTAFLSSHYPAQPHMPKSTPWSSSNAQCRDFPLL